MRSDVEHTLKPTDYTLRHLATLGHLRREPGLSYSELGRRAGITAQSAQATVRQLEERGGPSSGAPKQVAAAPPSSTSPKAACDCWPPARMPTPRPTRAYRAHSALMPAAISPACYSRRSPLALSDPRARQAASR
ncbi:MarR family transcriptional regulator [Streptomyces sp. NPDC021354]|uniref:MarR family transcriptional regulator n=1 Tax=Streptomyces sp. NPDC021354 TaxID=3154793 RepID=UPI0033FCCD77